MAIEGAAQGIPSTRSRPVVVTVFNQKGGVAKTTTSVNLALCLAAFGRQVALIDLDSQSNATANAGVVPPVATGAYHLITGRAPFADCLRRTPYEGLRLVGGSDELAWADIELALKGEPERGLLRAFADLPDDLDVIVIDCPPAPGVVSVNALVAADVVVMPVMPSPHALDGLHKAWWNVNRVRSNFNRDLNSINILLTMTEEGELTERLTEDIIGEFGPRVMPVLVPRDTAVLEAAARDLPVAVLAQASPAARAYLRVAEVLLARTVLKEPGAKDDAAARDTALARLAEWHDAVGNLPAHLARPGVPMPGSPPVPAWAADDQALVTAGTDPLAHWRWKLGAALLLILLGAILGYAGGVALGHIPGLPLAGPVS